MTNFQIEFAANRPHSVSVEIDRRFHLVIERTDDGLLLCVYPRTAGELWDAPYGTFVVEEDEIIALEGEMDA